MTLAGVVLRLVLWDTQSIVSVDGTAYIRMARSLAGLEAVASVHQYGYPALIALAHVVVSDWVSAARLVALVSGVALIPLLWRVAALWIRRPALRLLPAAAAAFLPLPVRYSLTTMTEMPYLVLVFAMVLLWRRGRAAAAGLAGGGAYWIRPESLVVAAALVLLDRAGRARSLRFGGALAAVVAVYVVGVGIRDDRWTLTDKTINIATASWEEAEERVGGEAVEPGARARLRRYGGETLAAYPRRLGLVTVELARRGAALPLVLAPLASAAPAAALAPGLVPFLSLPLNFAGERTRYVFPFLPFLWVLAAAAVDRFRPRPALLAGAALCAALSAGAALDRRFYTLNEDGWFPELVDAGRWLSALATPETLVFDRKPYTAFYAGARIRYVPTGPYATVLDRMVAEGGDYLVVNDWIVERFRPELLPLARDPDVVAGEPRLAPVYVDQSTRGLLTVIYRVRRPGGPPPFPGEDGIRAGLAGLIRGRGARPVSPAP